MIRNPPILAVAPTGLALAAPRGSITNAVAEQTGPGSYVNTFDAPDTAYPVGFFWVSRRGLQGAAEELATARLSALLLTLLAVPRETVVGDFLLNNKYLVPDEREPELAKQIQEHQKQPAIPDAESVRAASGVLATNLEIGFRRINEKYAAVDNSAREALKLSAKDMNKLRKRQVE